MKIPGVTTEASRVASGALWGVLSQGATLLAALLATPFTIRLLGPERYGVYGLLMVFLGNAAFVDLGMGVASTVEASKRVQIEDQAGERSIIWSALVLSMPVTILVATAAFVLSPTLSHIFFHLDSTPSFEVDLAVRAACFVLVVRAANAVFNTTSLARLNFRFYYLVTGLASVGSVLLVPILLKLGYGLFGLVILTGILATASLLLFVYRTWRDLGSLLPIAINRKTTATLLAIGTGVIFSYVAETMLGSLDKYLLSSNLGSRDLAHYIVAFNFGMLLVPIPLALGNALFPALSRAGKTAGAAMLARQATTVLAEVLFPLALILGLIAGSFLTYWAGPEYAKAGLHLAHVFLVGQLFAVFSYVPSSRLQSLGHTGTIARLNWVELAFYSVAAFFAIRSFGLVGACAVWTIRSAVHFCVATALNDSETRRALLLGIGRGVGNTWGPLILIAIGLAMSLIGIRAKYTMLTPLLGVFLLSRTYFRRLRMVLSNRSVSEAHA